MRKTRFVIVLAAILALLAGSLTVAHAQGPGKGKGPGMQQQGPGQGCGGGAWATLTPEQQAKAKKIYEEQGRTVQDLRHQLMAKRHELRTADPNDAKVPGLIKEIADLEGKTLTAHNELKKRLVQEGLPAWTGSCPGGGMGPGKGGGMGQGGTQF